jgi:beta-1,4-mannosyl-glycoprotein beta-1,4-N-acetylglucosaminyltransferase
MAVRDVFTYNGERDMLDLRLHALYSYVDTFVIVEAKTTFTGKPKPLYFSSHERFFKKFWNKIEYHIINEDYSPEEIALAVSSPNTQGASHWKNEFLQKESIQKALVRYCDDEDTVYIGDVDEIWEPTLVQHPTKLKLRVYAYYLNNRSDEQFWGTLVGKYKDIKGQCLNHLRTDPGFFTEEYAGWHFTSMGGVKEVRRKLNDSYTEESYNTKDVQDNLQDRVKSGTDYLGRPFNFTLDESEWPFYLKANRSKYISLCK